MIIARSTDAAAAARSRDAVEAARIWARAAAVRDGLAPPSALASSLAGVERRLAQGGVLYLARVGDRAVGFAVLVGPELVYLAVDPDVWGAGVASRLLAHVDEEALRAGFESLELWVIDDNVRAKAVYERAGWTPTGDLQDAGGRAERRLVKQLRA
ncbi:GNAT family N-acetyltransferase [Actinoplanes sp. NPDC023714]|uniref:GNAT family N-acetyltransferase n=1 Tax=Actinoplanes sp. NPDC023714 TaxID=3154322 RepID=UPI0033FC67CA